MIEITPQRLQEIVHNKHLTDVEYAVKKVDSGLAVGQLEFRLGTSSVEAKAIEKAFNERGFSTKLSEIHHQFPLPSTYWELRFIVLRDRE